MGSITQWMISGNKDEWTTLKNICENVSYRNDALEVMKISVLNTGVWTAFLTGKRNLIKTRLGFNIIIFESKVMTKHREVNHAMKTIWLFNSLKWSKNPRKQWITFICGYKAVHEIMMEENIWTYEWVIWYYIYISRDRERKL
jgi:hypothetical protein